MNDEENKIIEKIEKLIALSGSDNENEAKAAMLKAQELMAKYEIEQDRIDPGRRDNAPGKANADRENNIPAGERSKEHEDPD